MANRLRRALDLSDFVSVPLAAIGCSAVVLLSSPGFGAILGIASGAMAWTIVEYAVHRALHSRRFPRLRALHMRHHQHPAAASGGTLYSSLIVLALLATAIASMAAAPMVLGIYAGYYVFLLLHHGEHHGWDLSAVGHLAEHHHRHHHARPSGCFGVSTMFWDRLFGTL